MQERPVSLVYRCAQLWAELVRVQSLFVRLINIRHCLTGLCVILLKGNFYSLV